MTAVEKIIPERRPFFGESLYGHEYSEVELCNVRAALNVRGLPVFLPDSHSVAGYSYVEAMSRLESPECAIIKGVLRHSLPLGRLRLRTPMERVCKPVDE